MFPGRIGSTIQLNVRRRFNTRAILLQYKKSIASVDSIDFRIKIENATRFD